MVKRLVDNSVAIYRGTKGEEAMYRVYRPCSTAYYEGLKHQEKLVKIVLKNGAVAHFRGEKDEERLFKMERADKKSIKFFKGSKNEERLFKRHICQDAIVVKIIYYHGRKRCEYKIAEKTDGKLTYFEGNKGFEKPIIDFTPATYVAVEDDVVQFVELHESSPKLRKVSEAVVEI